MNRFGLPTQSNEDLALIDKIRSLILSEEQPGAKLREQALAQRFEVSRTPIREALLVLEREGLVSYEKNRGFSVRRMSLTELRDSYELRAVLEAYACGAAARAGLSVEAITDLRIGVRDVNQLLQQAEVIGPDGIDVWRQSNSVFHATLMHAHPNVLLQRTHETVGRVLLIDDWFRNHQAGIKLAMQKFNHDHSLILEAVIARDSGRAEFLMREHVMSAYRDLSAMVYDGLDDAMSPRDV